MESTVVKLQSPVTDEVCTVCQKQRDQLWFVDTDTDSLVCDVRCKHDLDLATEVLMHIFTPGEANLGGLAKRIVNSVEKSVPSCP